MTKQAAKDWAHRYWINRMKPSLECYVYGLMVGIYVGAAVAGVFISKIGLACTCQDILNACK